MFRMYVTHEGKRYTRVTTRKYEYAIMARHTSMIEDCTKDDTQYEHLQDLLRRARKMRKRFSDVIVKKARYAGEVYAVRYRSYNRAQDYEMVEPDMTYHGSPSQRRVSKWYKERGREWQREYNASHRDEINKSVRDRYAQIRERMRENENDETEINTEVSGLRPGTGRGLRRVCV